ncbi:MAG: MBL fold metallo-hydrolase [Planctomycetota bacterium]
MNVKTFTLGPLQTSCYLIYPERNSNNNSNAIIIDAGGDPTEMINHIKNYNLIPLYLVNTHGHIDHILGNPQIKKAFPEIKICIHPADAPMLLESKYNLSTELGFKFSSPEPDKLLNENDIISMPAERSKNEKSAYQLKVIHLPGHTKGGIGLFYKPTDNSRARPAGIPAGSMQDVRKQGKNNEPLLFSGDAIFAGSIGRTDFPGGSHSELVNNIRKKIFVLPENTIIYPGHGPATTVGDEKQFNPFFN